MIISTKQARGDISAGVDMPLSIFAIPKPIK
jgi:hypothetical protein